MVSFDYPMVLSMPIRLLAKVAQTSSLLYRRFPICQRSRLEVGDTAGWKPALRCYWDATERFVSTTVWEAVPAAAEVHEAFCKSKLRSGAADGAIDRRVNRPASA